MGREIARLQHALEDDTKPALLRDYPDADRVLEIVDRTIVDGAMYRDDIRDVVHGDADYEDVDWREVRAWGTHADGMAAFMRSSPEARQRIMDRYPG